MLTMDLEAAVLKSPLKGVSWYLKFIVVRPHAESKSKNIKARERVFIFLSFNLVRVFVIFERAIHIP
jgi:hypothetical protein